MVYTDPARAFVLAFSKQPRDLEVNVSDTVSLSVASSCNNVSYQWQRSYDDGETWHALSGENYTTLIIKAALNDNNALYRCVITAANEDQLSSESARISILSTANTYTTIMYIEKADGSGYELYEKVVSESDAGTSVLAARKTYAHFTENTKKGNLSGIVKTDNSLTLSRYFDRDSCVISYETNGGTTLPDTVAKYEAPVIFPVPTRTGCTFSGWYTDSELTEEYTSAVMPGDDLTLYAKWNIIGEERGVEYKINGITLRDSSYQIVSSFPIGMFTLKSVSRTFLQRQWIL